VKIHSLSFENPRHLFNKNSISFFTIYYLARVTNNTQKTHHLKMICVCHHRAVLTTTTTTSSSRASSSSSSSKVLKRGGSSFSSSVLFKNHRHHHHRDANNTNNNNNNNSRFVRSFATSSSKEDIDWDAQNDRFKAERIFDQCLGAIADGDEQALESCLLQIESEKKVAKLSKKLEEATPDAFWKKKVKEIAATRIVDDCMSAILSGDASEIDGCMVELESDMEYLEKN